MLKKSSVFWSVACLLVSISIASASDWPSWRGPNQNGVSDATGLVSDWTLDGKNLVWKADFIGRSTPVIMNGKVYVVGRTGEGVHMQRVVACYDAKDGKLIWEDKNNVFHTTVPFTRVGWASLGGDPETGNVYMLGVDGVFTCYDGDNGDIVWQHSLVEEFLRFSGYGGRTNTPIVDEELVHISFWTWSAWGQKGPPHPRFLAYDKRTGELVWQHMLASTPNNTNYSNPVFAMINGERAMVCGAPDGAIYALNARTGKEIWKFKLCQGAVQTSVIVENGKVYATHGNENLDNVQRGRIVCFNADGTGDITETNVVWKHDGITVGYASPLLHNGRLYVVSNEGNLIAFDAGDGETLWTFNLGTVGKGSPVFADGKIYATEVNGAFHIIKPGEKQAVSLDRKVIAFDEKRAAEVYSSPAIAYSRVYFTTEEGLYCLGDKSGEFKVTTSKLPELNEEPAPANAGIAHIQIVPAETWIKASENIDFKVRAFDSKGRKLGEKAAQFNLNGLQGKIDNDGVFVPDKNAGIQAGYVIARLGDLESQARIQVTPALPIEIDFENFAVDESPPYWPCASKFTVKNLDGNTVLLKPPSRVGLNRHNLFLAVPEMSGYTIQADVKGTKVKRRSPDMGVIANRYYFDFMTKKRQLQIRTWPAELERLVQEVPYEWNPDLWYTMKMRVDVADGKAIIKGKIWPRDETEPEAWTITAEDPHPNEVGSPGLYGDSATDIYYDNVKITRSN